MPDSDVPASCGASAAGGCTWLFLDCQLRLYDALLSRKRRAVATDEVLPGSCPFADADNNTWQEMRKIQFELLPHRF